jgi:hypothetical protein
VHGLVARHAHHAGAFMTFASRLLVLSLSLLAAAFGAHAESSLASSASDSLSASVGQSSNSLGHSSDSSSHHQDLARGDYKVIDVAAADVTRPGMVVMKLKAVDGKDDGYFTLTLPAATAQKNGIATGQVVTALDRPYGFEFAKADARGTKQPFFLVMQDDWHRELKANVVS